MGLRGVRVGPGTQITGPGAREISPGALIGRDVRIWIGPGAKFTLGAGAQIGDRSIINAAVGVEIEAGTAVSWDCQIIDTDFHQLTYPDGSKSELTGPVRIERDALIGFGVTVLKGVTIGAGAVIGARSVVTRSVDASTVAAGSPVRTLRQVASWSR